MLIISSPNDSSLNLFRIDLKKRKALAEKFGITGYLCPNRDHNLWCPTRPGMHGFMFVGLGREATTFAQAETRNVFVGMGTKQYRYLGLYEAVRTEGLTAEEWDPLPEEVSWLYTQTCSIFALLMYCMQFKSKYSATTKDKSKDDQRSASQIRAAYDDGSLFAPCVMLKCIGYDGELYRALAEVAGAAAVPVSTTITTKRIHESESSDALEVQRRKSARTSI